MGTSNCANWGGPTSTLQQFVPVAEKMNKGKGKKTQTSLLQGQHLRKGFRRDGWVSRWPTCLLYLCDTWDTTLIIILKMVPICSLFSVKTVRVRLAFKSCPTKTVCLDFGYELWFLWRVSDNFGQLSKLEPSLTSPVVLLIISDGSNLTFGNSTGVDDKIVVQLCPHFTQIKERALQKICWSMIIKFHHKSLKKPL